MSENTLRGAIEAILMVASEPVAASDLADVLGVSTADIEQHLRAIAAEYLGEGQERPRGFELREVAGGWRIYSARAYADVVGRFVVGSSHARLSQAALETLAVIAYRQPISRARICRIRGVNVDGVVRTLLARGLVEETGLTPSGARLYGTTGEFLEKMGLTANPYTEGGVRLQKVLAQAGVASRRASEQMIADGRVSVDGTVVRNQGVRVDPAKQVIHVDGERLILDETKHIVLAVNKPIGTVSTMSDPEGRPTIADLIADYSERLYHVGRLDIDTSGLLLLTNDGELANRLTHPKYEIRKTYVARLHGEVKPGVKRTLMNGIELEDGPIKVDSFRIVDTYGDITTVEIVVHEGRNRLVRRMMEAVGYPVRELVRTGFGPITLDHLKQGTTRRVKGNALSALYGAVGL